METGTRVNKYLSEAGVCSRREADRYVEEGRVQVDDKVAELGTRIMPEQMVLVDGKPIKREEAVVIIAFHKPRGVVCTSSKEERDNIIDYIGYKTRIYPVGRLDKDSEGLILLTNQGEWMDKILRGRNLHEKEYIVKVNKTINDRFLENMRQGVPILDTVTRPCTVERIDDTTFSIILTQGLNRQIRRMCEYLQFKVTQLQRIRIMNIQMGKLKLGTYRELTVQEIDELKKQL